MTVTPEQLYVGLQLTCIGCILAVVKQGLSMAVVGRSRCTNWTDLSTSADCSAVAAAASCAHNETWQLDLATNAGGWCMWQVLIEPECNSQQILSSKENYIGLHLWVASLFN